mgnify:CR=1 FL=1
MSAVRSHQNPRQWTKQILCALIVRAEVTASLEAKASKQSVATALKMGYRFLDCAEFYANEKAVGEGIAKSGVPREELFLASKVWNTTIYEGPEAVRRQFNISVSAYGRFESPG